MLSQYEADRLIVLIKYLKEYDLIAVPSYGQKINLSAQCNEGGNFLIDIRRGRIDVYQATFQTRYQKTIPLVRLDLEGPEHQNPDGEVIECPHLHIYKEGYDLKWAYPVKKELDPNFSNTKNLIQVLIDYLKYNNITNVPENIIDSLI